MRDKNMNLTLSQIIRKEEKHYCIVDNRRRTNYVLASYRDNNGYEYRKSFESYGTPIIPQFGTQEEINKLRTQF